MDAGERQVQVRFTTRLGSDLRVEATAFSLPVHLNRYGLSQIINTLLALDSPRPFDFLFDGELIRTTLEQLYLSKNLSAESILVLEYILAVGPPELQSSQPEKDWVSAVNGVNPSLILSGSYDSFARAWFPDGTCGSVLKGHSDAITSIAVAGSSNDTDLDVITSSKDKTLRLWKVPLKPSSSTLSSVRIFKGHAASVQCVAASPSNTQVCSGSWDSTIKLWKIDSEDEDNEDEQALKKRKLDGAKQSIAQVTAFTTHKEHTQCVAALEWPEDRYIFSASWDHSFRQWDVETSINTLTMTCSKALHCLSVGGEGSSLVATGGADPVLRIWDTRMPGTVVPVLQLTSHTSWISACKWHRQSPKHLLTSSYDGTVKMWDIRSKVPLQTVEAHKDKVLCADWWREDTVVTGGADCEFKLFKYTPIEWL
ncbi:hypothetical protein SELMODRAFT_175982 [Selaginella moellendorffii]|uniref:Ribosome biogenesis protein WDR12 homolog n=1 Tax=Selaginella moellendorffii TaxID=88036 RepID=D8S0Z4_SELML|nr:ribosome biogenesis protein WDR12 homolog [Selaginella moellendorffii]EFJ22134.1 hypothetical protein SELMODRAFT_175982 [Selaginella moellendorffii]|eukprot:XP_024537593.1 ribosome biogenesis protein WDR12 homolog [Selaginella moellendorffii]